MGNRQWAIGNLFSGEEGGRASSVHDGNVKLDWQADQADGK